jgi:Zn-dependent membrane protease YugP
MLFDGSYFLYMIPAIILVGWAQYKVKSAYAKFSQVANTSGLSGAQLARALLDRNGLADIGVEPVAGELTDHYDPRGKVLRLSEGIYGGRSVAASGIVAHEVGHAVQDAKDYVPMRIRSGLVPVASFGSSLGPMLVILGFFLRFAGLINLGIIVFAAAVLFQIVTLPVEINASSRALVMLRDGGYIYQEEYGATRKVLSAAAYTYLAATLASIMMLLYYIGLGRRN